MNKNTKKKKVLITGALGHIGSQLIRNLDKTVITDVLLLDSLESRRYASLFDLPGGVKYKFVQDDVLSSSFKKHLTGVWAVIHLAAVKDEEGSYKIPGHEEAVNFHGLKNVADACLEKKVRLFFPSTASVYGSQASQVDETCVDLKPQSSYARTKLDSEIYLRKLGKNGLKFVICRFGTIFGHSVGMRFDTAVNRFVWQAANRLPITVWKTALHQKRPYLYLGDAVRAINLVLKKDLFNREIYNVVTQNFTVNEVVGTIKKFVPELTVSYVDSPSMNNLSYDVDDSKFRKLGFKPTGNLKKGISEKVSSLKGIMET